MPDKNLGTLYERQKKASSARAKKESQTLNDTTLGTIHGSAYVNLRKEPSLTSDVKRVMPRGTEVDILEQVDDFYKVTCKQFGTGYVKTNYCERKKASS